MLLLSVNSISAWGISLGLSFELNDRLSKTFRSWFSSAFAIQIINVYNQQYESAAAFWPHVHGRIIGSLLISQFLLMGLLSTKKAARSTPLLIALPILTIAFHMYCKSRFEPAFKKYPLEVSSITIISISLK